MAAFRKRLTGSSKNFHIINLTLTLIETTVKNCGVRLHLKIAQRDFLKDLTSVINPKVFKAIHLGMQPLYILLILWFLFLVQNNPPTIVRERVLGLIQYWADSFKGRPQLSAVVELYEQLKDEGTEFPPVDLDSMAPVETPIRVNHLSLLLFKQSEHSFSPLHAVWWRQWTGNGTMLYHVGFVKAFINLHNVLQ